MCRRAVREWLVLLTMEKYIGRFLERGYDSIAHCKLIVVSDLIMLGVDDASHRKLLLDGVQFLINAPEGFICEEPCELHHNSETDPDLEVKSAPTESECFKSFSFLKTLNRDDVGPTSISTTVKRALNQEFNKLILEEIVDSDDMVPEKGEIIVDGEDLPPTVLSAE
ncbi:uncharacterized protein LOC108041167 [Drosophila rhopaloa]|uniref:SAM domain-containing protein n=1 Tax=Drosophila rhopaloa TaxID=1041015 RepID=A0ABM5H4T1_DRORH|nr:uncharacterized protein LOC108041167 [Drosophila rhopaloa]